MRTFTRSVEFDFVGWTVRALGVRSGEFVHHAGAYLQDADRQALVREYFRLLENERVQGRELEMALSDPEGTFSSQEIDALRSAWEGARAEVDEIQPIVETIMQEQVAETLINLGLGKGGKLFPPVAFKFTALPVSLIISPREVIRRDQSVSLEGSLSLEQKIALEEAVAQSLDVSALVENVGGISTYPTMVVESTSIVWLFDVITHEWVHNYLTFRPLGLNYNTSEDLRTMNETTASLLGGEVGLEVLRRYYPDLVPPPSTPPSENESQENETPPMFDFQHEMHITRLEADRLLSEGQIEQAEAYMEARRQVFWEHGYLIRKLNQAYFAFHGAYAATSQGAAGDDPVGSAVRTLWERSDSPVEFLRTMAWMNEFSDLERLLDRSDASE